jgi:hypothetical protein
VLGYEFKKKKYQKKLRDRLKQYQGVHLKSSEKKLCLIGIEAKSEMAAFNAHCRLTNIIYLKFSFGNYSTLNV